MKSRLSRFFRVGFFLAIYLPILVLRGAAGGDPSPTPTPASADSAKPDARKLDYVLQPQDLIRVQILREEDLNREVRVSQELTVALPLIGTIDLRGKTVRQAEEEIRKAYDAEYLVNPQVNVFVIEYWKRFVKVFGAVNSPGVVVFPPEEGLTLLGAISRAGGFSRLADTKKVILSRTAPDGKTETSTVNAEDLLKRGTGADVALLPDDIINVGERIL
jgi:polysaccharide export outer membrane protein